MALARPGDSGSIPLLSHAPFPCSQRWEGWWDLEGAAGGGENLGWDGGMRRWGHLSPQRVDMHKEKVSRREIGSLTISKRFPSHQKIMSPPSPPCLEPYYRKPLNFSVLDDIGHGIKVSPGLGGCPTGVRDPWLGFLAPQHPQS